MSAAIFINTVLVALLQCSYTVLLSAALIVQAVFFCIDYYHTVANGPGYLILWSTFEGHVCYEVRNFTHFVLSILHRLKFNTVAVVMDIAIGILNFFVILVLVFRIEPL